MLFSSNGKIHQKQQPPTNFDAQVNEILCFGSDIFPVYINVSRFLIYCTHTHGNNLFYYLLPTSHASLVLTMSMSFVCAIAAKRLLCSARKTEKKGPLVLD